MKNFVLALAAIASLLIFPSVLDAQNPWKIQQKYQRQWKKDNYSRSVEKSHPSPYRSKYHRANCFPQKQYFLLHRESPIGQKGFYIGIGKLNFSIIPRCEIH